MVTIIIIVIDSDFLAKTIIKLYIRPIAAILFGILCETYDTICRGSHWFNICCQGDCSSDNIMNSVSGFQKNCWKCFIITCKEIFIHTVYENAGNQIYNKNNENNIK